MMHNDNISCMDHVLAACTASIPHMLLSQPFAGARIKAPKCMGHDEPVLLAIGIRVSLVGVPDHQTMQPALVAGAGGRRDRPGKAGQQGCAAHLSDLLLLLLGQACNHYTVVSINPTAAHHCTSVTTGSPPGLAPALPAGPFLADAAGCL